MERHGVEPRERPKNTFADPGVVVVKLRGDGRLVFRDCRAGKRPDRMPHPRLGRILVFDQGDDASSVLRENSWLKAREHELARS